MKESVEVKFNNDLIKVEQQVYNSVWSCSYNAYPVPEDQNAIDLKIKFKVTEGSLTNANVAFDLKFDSWDRSNYVLMPAAVYNGNRFHIEQMNYSPYFSKPEHFRKDLPVTVNNIPHLSLTADSSKIEQTTGDLATPAMGFQSQLTGKGFWLLTEQKSRLGNYGMNIEENMGLRQAVFQVTAPYVRENRATIQGPVPSTDRGAAWEKGDETEMHVRLYFFNAPEVQDLFNKFVNIRQAILKADQAEDILPFSKAWQLMQENKNSHNWISDPTVYTMAPEVIGWCEGMSGWDLGWCGDGMMPLAFIFNNDSISVQRSITTLDVVIRESQAPSGLFYTSYRNGKWENDRHHSLMVLPDNQTLIRKQADFLYAGLKQFRLLEKRDTNWVTPAAWKTAFRKFADAFVTLWEENGQFGQFIDVETGKILVGGTTSASLAPAALMLAGRYFDQPEYEKVARESAHCFYHNFVIKGFTNGGPGDILQAPDSESAFAMLESFVVLSEYSNVDKWLVMAEDMARQCATWIVSYDYEFPDTSTFAKMNMQTTGTCFANTQNKHSAPGLCTISPVSLLNLFRATGNIFYLDLMRDISHAQPQFLSTAERPVVARTLNSPAKTMIPGTMNERVQMSDWEAHWLPVGEIFDGSNWSEVALMLTTIEIPGLYIQPDKGLVYAADHIEAELLKRENGILTLQVHNPTRYKAEVRTLVETSEQAKQPLGVNSLYDKPVIELEADETRVLEFR